jgi:hypothetical protein
LAKAARLFINDRGKQAEGKASKPADSRVETSGFGDRWGGLASYIYVMNILLRGNIPA